MREITNTAVLAAVDGFKQAPAHVQVMAGPYVKPLLAALTAINVELAAHEAFLDELAENNNSIVHAMMAAAETEGKNDGNG